MSDSLNPFSVYDAPSVPTNDTPTNTVGWTLKTTISPGQPLTYDDTSPLPRSYKVIEQTANGVVVPYNVQSASNASPGSVAWSLASLGPASSFTVTATCRDSSGNIYCTGYFSTAGTFVFKGTTSATISLLIKAGDLWFAKFSSSGAILLAKNYGKATGTASPLCISADSTGIAIGGSFTGTQNFGGIDWTVAYPQPFGFIAKYDTSGNHLWSWGNIGITNPQVAGSLNNATGIGLDSSGNVVASGRVEVDNPGVIVATIGDLDHSYFGGGNPYIWLAKFRASDGHTLWIAKTNSRGGVDISRLVVDKRINPTTGLPDTIILVGAGGDVLVGGDLYGVDGTRYFGGFLSTWRPDTGALVSSRPIGASYVACIPTSVAVLSDGSMAVSGNFYGTQDFGGGNVTSDGPGFNSFVVKYDSGLVFLWQCVLKTDQQVKGAFVSVDASDNISAGGDFFKNLRIYDSSTLLVKTLTAATDGTLLNPQDAWAAKFLPSGRIVWANNYGDLTDDALIGGTVDSSGFLSVIGNVTLNGTLIYLLKLN